MALKLSPISSPTAAQVVAGETSTRDCALDLTNVLETAEVVSSATAASSDNTILTTSSVSGNAATFVNNKGDTVDIGKGVLFTVTAVAAGSTTITVSVWFLGDGGTSETYDVLIPVVNQLNS